MRPKTFSPILRACSARLLGPWLLLSPLPAVAGPSEQSITLREVVQLAMDQGSDVLLARLQVEKSSNNLALAKGEGSLQVHAGSGLGGTYGIPQSVQGAVPSVAQMTLRQPLLDRSRSRRVAVARESVRFREFASESAAEESAYLAGVLFLDLGLAVREVDRLRTEVESFERIERLTAERVAEGTEVPLALSRSRLDSARAAERLASGEARVALLESELKSRLGITAEVRLRPKGDPEDAGALTGETAGRDVMSPSSGHPDISALDARIRAARSRAAEARSERLPRLDLVGQYALLAKFNNYDDYFRRFQRHNWQAGVAFEVPLFQGRAVAERIARARLEERELELRQSARRAAIELEWQRAGSELRRAERRGGLAQQELDFARESVDLLLAQYEEGLIPLDELERGRVVESSAWGGLIAARYDLAKARLAAIRATGGFRDALGD